MMHIRWNKQWGIPLITGAVSFIAGTGAGYLLAHARLSKKVKEVEANQQLLRDHFSEMQKLANRQPPEAKIERTEPISVAESHDKDEETMRVAQARHQEYLAQVADDLPYPDDDPADTYLVPKSGIRFDPRVFADLNDHDDWDYAVEVPKRGDTHPYIIHRDEFMAEESGFRQSSLTYYSGDNILTDEKDQPIYNHELVAGTLRFGHGSKDPSIVYVRNPKLESEFEIILDEGHYQVEVLGAVIEDQMSDDDLKHSVRKFRRE